MTITGCDISTHARVGAVGDYGGRFVSELLIPALEELSEAVEQVVPSPEFQRDFERELAHWAGRPTPLTRVPRFSEEARLDVVLKREDLLHGGAHKTNNVIGQGLLARSLGKRRLIAETGAGQHGVATAMVAARLGLCATVYMGAKDVERQRPNVQRMELLGAQVVAVEAGSRSLKDAINEALRDWARTSEDSHYLLGTVCGPAPYPQLVGDLHAVIGREAARQWGELGLSSPAPAAVFACVGGGSNAIGAFRGFVDDPDVRLFGAEPAGKGLDTAEHGATLIHGSPGILHGARTYVLQESDGQIGESHSAAAGLDYPGVGPEHAFLRDSGRASYHGATDDEALSAFELLSRAEGIVPAFESAHALALVLRAVDEGLVPEGAPVLINLSGRGDKDLGTYFQLRAAAGGAR
ncbi:MAG: tryptophan synthase subunit beta [Planctomycetota bacterium]